jgi:hypothetical protein
VSFVLGGRLHAAGGLDFGLNSSSVERYDVASDTWTAIGDMSEARHFFGAVAIGCVDPIEVQDLFDSLIAEAVWIRDLADVQSLLQR